MFNPHIQAHSSKLYTTDIFLYLLSSHYHLRWLLFILFIFCRIQNIIMMEKCMPKNKSLHPRKIIKNKILLVFSHRDMYSVLRSANCVANVVWYWTNLLDDLDFKEWYLSFLPFLNQLMITRTRHRSREHRISSPGKVNTAGILHYERDEKLLMRGWFNTRD